MDTKKALFLMCAIVLAVTTTTLIADNHNDDGSEPAVRTPQRPQRPGPAGRGPVAEPGQRGRGPADRAPAQTVDREEMYEQLVNRRQQAHQAEIDKLEAILKIAKEEKAVETAEAIQRLIDEKNKAFDEQTEAVESRRRDAQQRIMEMRHRQRDQGDQGDQPAAPARPQRPGPRSRRPAPPQDD